MSVRPAAHVLLTSSSTAIAVFAFGVLTLGLAACSGLSDRTDFASVEPSVYTPANDPWVHAQRPAPQKTAYVPPKGNMPILPPVPSERSTGLPPVSITGSIGQMAYQAPVTGTGY